MTVRRGDSDRQAVWHQPSSSAPVLQRLARLARGEESSSSTCDLQGGHTSGTYGSPMVQPPPAASKEFVETGQAAGAATVNVRKPLTRTEINKSPLVYDITVSGFGW
jgi:hypothetical protein